jgi:hypothetical protein
MDVRIQTVETARGQVHLVFGGFDHSADLRRLVSILPNIPKFILRSIRRKMVLSA